ncbi:MAG: isoleucine--tRNA ligase [Candidatus Nezhaarchaeales archaeon]
MSRASLGVMDVKLKYYEPTRIEQYIRSYWNERNLINKCFEARRGGKLFSFLEGPPTTNGFMHVGHARGRTLKDVVIKFKLMQGFDVWRRAGWDTQGLPVELEVEKSLGLRTKKDIEIVGYEKFVEECNRLVDYYMNHWRRASELLGLWLDYDNAYETRKREYIEFIWWALKQAYEKGLLVEDLKVIAFCPRCETPLSDQEVALGYASVEDPSIYVKIPLLSQNPTYVIIWTTTPWTLPANESVCLHPSESYVEVEVQGERWILAEKLLEKVMKEVGVEEYKVIRRLLGSELEGTKYLHPLLDEVPEHKMHENSHVITCDQGVSMEEGSGCVHIAPAHGPEDFEIGRRYSLPIFCPVDVNGVYTHEAGKYKGMYVKDANKLIIEDLRKKGLLVYEGTVVHDYPHCWRCDTPLIYRADRQWFLRIEPIKSVILEENKRVRWVPPWAGEARFHNWIVNARDWCISRSRIWGSPLNIWTCTSCNARVCVGSLEELKKLALTPIETNMDLHRPWIDAVKLKCPNCGGEMKREPYVLDCWLDSGVAHAASVNYLKDRVLFEKVFPYDFITEAVDQTRGWFFSLIFTSVMLFGKSPYKSVLCQGHVLDKLGQKMSKSRGNVVWALDVIEKEGADPLRLYLVMKAAPWESLNFDIDELKAFKRLLNTIFNVFKFASTYMELDKFNYTKHPIESFLEKLGPEDRWVLSRIQTVIEQVTSNIENFNIHEAAKAIVNFLIEDLSHGYIRFIRRRVWLEEEDVEKLMTYSVLYYVLNRALRLLAPFTPHLAEWLYLEFLKKVGDINEDSIFMLEWPSVEHMFIDKELEEAARQLMNSLTLIANARQKAKLKSRWPVSEIIIVLFNEDLTKKLKMFQRVLHEQANARNVIITDKIPNHMKLKIRVRENVERKLGGKAARLHDVLDRISLEDALRELCVRGKMSINLEGEEVYLDNEDVEVIGEGGDGRWTFVLGKYMLVCLNTTRDKELEAEALAREIVRRVQYMRKELDLNVEDYIDLIIKAEEGALSILSQKNIDYLKSEVRAKRLDIASKAEVYEEGWYTKEWDINGLKVIICLRKSVL